MRRLRWARSKLPGRLAHPNFCHRCITVAFTRILQSRRRLKRLILPFLQKFAAQGGRELSLFSRKVKPHYFMNSCVLILLSLSCVFTICECLSEANWLTLRWTRLPLVGVNTAAAALGLVAFVQPASSHIVECDFITADLGRMREHQAHRRLLVAHGQPFQLIFSSLGH